MATEHHNATHDQVTLFAETSSLLQNEYTLESRISPQKGRPLEKLQLAALCAIRLVDPIAFTQIFPYINEMLQAMHVTDDPSKIGFYSGMVESAFAIAQLISIYQWARLSDVVGRRPVVILGTVGIAFTSFMFGLSRTLAGVLAARALAGIFCGNVAVIQSILAEITDSSNQAIAYPLFGLMWPLGVIVGPLLGGALSKPNEQFPQVFDCAFFRTFPYFLPCAVASCICLLGAALALLFLEETLPIKTRMITRDYSVSYGAADHDDDMKRELPPPSAKEILSLPIIRAICASGFALSFVETAFDVVFVLVCYSPISSGGLHFSPSEIGYSLATCGSLAACVQLFLLPVVLRRFDTARVYTFCMGLWPCVFLMMPLLNAIARSGLQDDEVSVDAKALVWIGVAIMLALSRLGCLAYSLNMILVKENAPSVAALGATNGIATFAQCFARAISPAVVSSLFALSSEKQLLRGYMWVATMVAISIFGCILSTGIAEGRRVVRSSR
ncbi:MFS general substrate transporter [Gloeophyllum trabeum ATCC 11539]|uniref:MFS general substrate transporter n=1 Tax=Gloeophyllum trabeum (strain ATCC 11539 / FP-39264 / Madison 617) TaxID=670483 RepID=S7RYA7_GLOTA|nr:MFS general substrate transporter [Gloeophyllum trabeum ATCC 11539]EPQ58389.1 MFS general substrate transporter [Gloeophyllum trabeum ATCC 11539]